MSRAARVVVALRRALRLIVVHDWVQGCRFHWHRGADGEMHIVGLCLVGALDLATRTRHGQTLFTLATQHIRTANGLRPTDCLQEWNDATGRRCADVMVALQRAIALAEAEARP